MTDGRSSAPSAIRIAALAVVAAVALQACGDTVTQVGESDVVELRVTPDSGLVPVGGTLQLRAYPLDETGAIIAGVQVDWASSDPTVATVGETGEARGLAVGEVEIVATAAGRSQSAVVAVLLPASIEFSPDTASFSAAAGAGDPTPDTVLVLNGGEFPLVNMTLDSIVYGSEADGWLMASLGATAAPSSLTLTPTVVGLTTAGAYRADVWLSGADVDPAAVTVALEITPGVAAQVAVDEGDAQEAAVGTAVPVAPSVVVSDAFGNVVPGASVTFAVASGGGSVTGATVSTGADGVARVGGWTLGTASGANTLTATHAGLPAVTITASAVAGAPATLELSAGNGQNAIAGTAVSVAPAVRVRDAFGNGVPEATVDFTVTAGGGDVTEAPATSAADGTATVGSWVVGPVAGANTLIATVDGVADTVAFTATGVPGAAARIAQQAGDAQSDTIDATLASPYAVKVADVNGNGVVGVTVGWAVTGGGGSIGALSTTDAAGVATATHVLGTTAGAQTVSASVSGLSGSPVVFTSTALAGAPTAVSVAGGDGQTAVAGTGVPTAPSVLVRDRAANPVAGASVTFTVTGGGGSLTGATATTDASGVARVGSWTLGTAAGGNALSASVPGVASVGFTATGTPGAATQLALNAGDSQSSVAGTAVSTPPSVIVTDTYGNGVSGESVQFAVASGGGSVTGAVAVTDASGVAAVGSWTLGSTAGPNTLDASVAGIAGVVTFQATALSDAAAQMLMVGGDAQVDTVAATLATPYSVRIVDDFANPVPGIPVSWTVTAGGGSITLSSVTDASGVATAIRALGTGAGVQTAQASVGGLAGSPQLFTATATPGAPALRTLNDGSSQSATVGTNVTTPPSVKVTDQFGNPVSGVPVAFAVTQNNGSVTGDAQVTDGNGIARVGSWQLGTLAGANGLSATPTGLAAIAFAATGTADVADRIEVNAGNLQTGTVAGSPVPIRPSVLVSDQYGNAVTGTLVTFTVTQGGGGVTGATPTSLASGIATVGSWTMGPTVGTNELTATVAGVGAVAFSATSIAGAAARMELAGGTPQTDTIGATLATPYSVRVVDANSNPVAGTSVTWSVSGGGSITPTSVTDGSGIATATRVLGTAAGSQAAQGSVGGLADSPVAFAATATAGAPTSMVAGGGTTPQSATVNTAVGVDPRVIVRDRAANPVPGVAVTFSVTGGGGSVDPVTAVSTLSDGTATVTSWTLGITAGPSNNTLTALAAGAGIGGNPVTFTATANAGAPATVVPTAGNALTTVTGTVIPTSPAAVVRDAYGNPVPNVTVNFSPSAGGSVGTPSASTNAAGVATTSWTVSAQALSDPGYSLPADGRFVNTLSATAVGGSNPSTQFTGYARYSFPTHVNGVWVASGCTVCHTGTIGTSGLTFDTPGDAATNHARLVGVSSVTACSSLVRISNAGGAPAESASLLLQFAGSLARGFSVPAGCSHPTKMSDANTEILRAWVRNSAPSN